MLIGFFIGIILLITLVIFAINPITQAVYYGITNHNLAIEKRRLKEEEAERKENELEAIRRETEELRKKLKLETEINDKLRKQSDERLYNQSSVSTNRHEPIRTFDQDYYDWGLDEPVGMSIRRRKGDWEIW